MLGLIRGEPGEPLSHTLSALHPPPHLQSSSWMNEEHLDTHCPEGLVTGDTLETSREKWDSVVNLGVETLYFYFIYYIL